MRLSELDAEFLGKYRIEDGHVCYSRVPSLQGAQGVMFQCPKCAESCERGQEGSRRFFVGAHYIICWFAKPIGAEPVPDHADPKPGRWTPQGTGLDDLTFVPGDPPMAVSVLLTSGCGWHGYVRNGETVNA